MVKWARWHLRDFQAGFLAQWRRKHLGQLIFITFSMKSSPWWWTRPPNLLVHRSLGPISWSVLTSDASQLGWGAHFQDLLVQERWRFNAEGMISNILELRAAWMAILHLAPLLRGRSILLQMENRAAVAYVLNPGGMRRFLASEVAPIISWAENNLIDFRAAYIPAPENQLADRLLRSFNNNIEWSLNPQVFRWICQQWATP